MQKTTKRRTQIEIETREITVIRTNGNQAKQFCESCGTNVWMLAHAEFAELIRAIESASIHFIDASPGSGLICGNSAITAAIQIQTKTTRREEL